MGRNAHVCNNEQLYALIDAEAGILIYSLFKQNSQIISHSKNFEESKHLKFDQIYIIR